MELRPTQNGLAPLGQKRSSADRNHRGSTAIHPFEMFLRKHEDTRVKPGMTEGKCARLRISPARLFPLTACQPMSRQSKPSAI